MSDGTDSGLLTHVFLSPEQVQEAGMKGESSISSKLIVGAVTVRVVQLTVLHPNALENALERGWGFDKPQTTLNSGKERETGLSSHDEPKGFSFLLNRRRQ